MAGRSAAAVAFAVAREAGADGYVIVLHCLVQAIPAAWTTGDVSAVLTALARVEFGAFTSPPRPPHVAPVRSRLARPLRHWPPSCCAAPCPPRGRPIARTLTTRGVRFKRRDYVGPWMTGQTGIQVRVRFLPHHDHQIEVYHAATGRCLDPRTWPTRPPGNRSAPYGRHEPPAPAA
ncbi:Mu transposase C-terminal domain-containing protein [Streptomyces sp. NPDC004296]|uniref:Mu transposase C-terminal domain-containing protein n=1 Tax=Streptomyces sp. NPDC004296 TaxID=3364697 RepID=UPI00367C5331